jgi:predicted nucleic acid-binding protein
MRKLFVDTWGWLTLYDQREQHHQDVVNVYATLRTQGGKLYTTDYVLDETFTLMFKRLPFSQAQRALCMLDTAIDAGYLILEWINEARFVETKALRLKFQDKPYISFTDLSSMVAMTDLGISHILTADAHFLHVGMGFEPTP